MIAPTTFRRQISGRRPEIWVLVFLELFGAAFAFACAMLPITGHRYLAVGLIVGATSLGLAITNWFGRSMLGGNGILVTTVAGLAVIGAAVATPPTEEGVLLAAYGYLWMTAYVASFFARRVVYALLVAIALGSGVAFEQSAIPRWFFAWLFLNATAVAAALVIVRSTEQLRWEAGTDPLTGLLNRRGFERSALLERAVYQRLRAELAVVMIDLDEFKAVNDAEGHVAGDRLLAEATGAWRRQLRAGDLLARYGGDEFVLLLPVHGGEEIEHVLGRLRQAHAIAWTGGWAIWGEREELAHCIERADASLYDRKRERGGDTGGE